MSYITGNYGSSYGYSSVGALTYVRSFSGQKYVPFKPMEHHVPLPYSLTFGRASSSYVGAGGYKTYGLQHSPLFTELTFHLGGSPESKRAYNVALSRYIDKYSGSAGLGITMVQYVQSRNMVAGRALQLYRAFNAVRRGKFKKFLKILRVKALPKHRRKSWNRPGQASGLILEYYFGWLPMVMDIYEAWETLVTVPPAGSFSTSCKFRVDLNRSSQWSYYTQFHNGYYFGRVRVGGRVQIINPNLHLLESWGLLNPGTVLLDLIPFSFVVNWFKNLQQQISNWTLMSGVYVHDAYSNYKVTVKGKSEWHTGTWDHGTVEVDALAFARTVGGLHNYYELPFSFSGFRKMQGLFSVSLLVQALDSIQSKSGKDEILTRQALFAAQQAAQGRPPIRRRWG